MLKIENLRVSYGDVKVLHEVSLEVPVGEIYALIGGNGAGKTTLVSAISGLIAPRGGALRFQGAPLNHIPAYRRVEEGITLVPEGRRLFPNMTVLENLELGAYVRRRHNGLKKLDWVFDLFPVLRGKRSQLAGRLSGGQQQMCAIGRGLMSEPKFLMLDEPSLGLAPNVVKEIYRVIRAINSEGVTVLLVEQNVQLALSAAIRGCVLEEGTVVLKGTSETLFSSERLKKAYLGL